jgi:hypothetical protein
MTISPEPSGQMPDDGSVSYYLHCIIGFQLKPHHCIEIMRRMRVHLDKAKASAERSAHDFPRQEGG